MKRARFFLTSVLCLMLGTHLHAQDDEIIKNINTFGTFDNWCVREIEESGLIGGKTKYLYEFFGSPSDTLRTGKKPFSAPVSNVLVYLAPLRVGHANGYFFPP